MRTITPPPVVLTVQAGRLLAAANTPTDTLSRDEQTGYEGPVITGWSAYDPCADDADDGALGIETVGPEIISGMPFVVLGPDVECTTLNQRFEDLAPQARTALDAIESAAISRELWTGELRTASAGVDPASPWLENLVLAGTGTTDLTPGGGAGSLLYSVGALEVAGGALLGAGVPVIHCARSAVPYLVAEDIVRREGDLLLTALDTRVVADAGYPGTSPAGAAPAADTAWLYLTARPTVHRGPVMVDPTGVSQALDRDTNRITVHASRLVLVTAPTSTVYAINAVLEV
jgi:hypothetical protein